LNGGCSFDVIVEPPTESADYWEVGVFASRKAINMLTIASNSYDGVTYNSVLGMSRHTERMFRGSEDNLEVECGFLSQLTAQSYANHKYGFAHKTTNIPHSQEMMDCVYDGVMSTLFEAVEEARLHLSKRIGVGLDRFSRGGFNLDD
jgi:hypothetical protein